MFDFGSRRVKTPSGEEWRIGRRWSSRRRPRWRTVDLGEGAEAALDSVGWIPVDVGTVEGIEGLFVGLVALAVLALIVIPLLLFGIELIALYLAVAAGILARSAFGRPWVVEATPTANPSGALAWEAKGWRRSRELIEQVTAEVRLGQSPEPSALLTPPPTAPDAG